MTERADGGSTTIYQTAQQQAGEISAFIPPRGIPVEERKKLNSQVRVLLPLASDLTIALLMLHGHDLSRREFLARLKEQRIEQMEAAFAVMENISRIYHYRNPFFTQLHESAVRCAPETSVDRMVDVIDKAVISPMSRDDRNVFAAVLSVHPQIDEIVDHFIERKGRNAWYTDWINEIKAMADAKTEAATNS